MNNGNIEFQALWHGMKYDTTRAMVVARAGDIPLERPYIALTVGGVRIAFDSALDARAVVLALADAIDDFELAHGDEASSREAASG